MASSEALVLRGRVALPRAHGLRRERLLASLTGPGAPAVVFVVAPAGCGKTVLLSHLAEAQAGPVAWLTLDHPLGEPAALLAHLRLALAAALSSEGRAATTPGADGTSTTVGVGELSRAAGLGEVSGIAAADETPAEVGSGEVPGAAGPGGLRRTVDELLASVERRLDALRPAGVLLLLDDLHAVAGTPAAELVRQLVDRRPSGLRLVLASRAPTGLEPWRETLRGDTRRVGPADLRFRTWEVEELRRIARRPRLRPEEVALLAGRTGGWAAGLQLFDLATSRMTPSARERLLRDEARSGLLTRDYLAGHVIAGVPARLRDFVLRSSVLVELTPARCAAVLAEQAGLAEQADLADPAVAPGPAGATASATPPNPSGAGRAGLTPEAAEQYLVDLVGLGLLAAPGPVSDAYTQHEVLRVPLLAMATAELGEAEIRTLHARAGAVLRAEGALVDAVRSFARAGDQEAVRQLVRHSGPQLAGSPGSWLDALPASLHDSDPWVAVAAGRRLLAEGALSEAGVAYRRAAALMEPDSWESVVGAELRGLSAWLSPPLGAVDDWVVTARRMLITPAVTLRAPVSGRRTPHHRLARGLGLLVCGRLAEADDVFAGLLGGPAPPPVVEAAALLGQAVAQSLAMSPSGVVVRQQARYAAETARLPALERLAAGLDLLCAGGGSAGVEHLVRACRDAGDSWGESLLGLFAVASALPGPAPAWVDPIELATRLRASQAPALAVWAQACAALAARGAGSPWSGMELLTLGRVAAAVGPLPAALVALAGGHAPGERRRPGERSRREASSPPLGASTWLRLLADGLRTPAGPGGPLAGATGALQVRCLGGFRLSRDEALVDLDGLRPRHQALLRALCLHAGEVVHREQLMEWFWPERDPARATRNLQVAISAVRRVVEEADGPVALRRHGDGYRLELGDGDCDVVVLRARLAALPRVRGTGDRAALERALVAVMSAAAGELLPADGPAEWVVAERESLRLGVVAAAEELSALLADDGRHVEAAEVATNGLSHDRGAEELWRRLTRALQEAGRPGAAREAHRQHSAVVRELAAADTEPPGPPHPRSVSTTAGT